MNGNDNPIGKVVVLGAAGQLGTDLCKKLSLWGNDVLPMTHRELDVCQHDKVTEILMNIKPYTVINTTAFHKLEACESDPERAFAVNTFAVRNLAHICDRISANFIHVSTDYVFDGDQRTPYKEDDPPTPVNAYGMSKVAGEYFVRNLCRKYILIRTSGLYGVKGASDKGGNFVETMRRKGREQETVTVVTDQTFSPTYTSDLAEKIIELLASEAQGIFHVTNAGECSWYEFAKTIFELTGAEVEVTPATTGDVGSTIARPSYSVLGNYRLKEAGLAALRPYREALAAYLEAKGN